MPGLIEEGRMETWVTRPFIAQCSTFQPYPHLQLLINKTLVGLRAPTGELLLNRLFGNKLFILEKVTEAHKQVVYPKK